MSKATFQACPPGTIETRPYTDANHEARTLWRTALCAPDRWHYIENGCNCRPTERVPGVRPCLSDYRRLGYVLAPPVETEHGRLWGVINEWERLTKLRVDAAARQARAAACAVGPRPALEIPVTCPCCGGVI